MSDERVVVPITFTPDDLHLMQECLIAVAENLHDELEDDVKDYVRRRCAEVMLKVQDFIIEANFLVEEAVRGSDDQGMDDHPPGIDVYRAVFGGRRKKQSLD
jgi:hypothetical protein